MSDVRGPRGGLRMGTGYGGKDELNTWMFGCGISIAIFGLVGIVFYLLDYFRVGYNEMSGFKEDPDDG